MAILTLTTDFGLQDSYVAEVKGVLLTQVPSLNIVDVTHEVPAYNIELGAFQLLRSYPWFPSSAYHLVVVDPGVGTERKCLFIKTGWGTFIGPDNGVLLWAVRDAEARGGKKAQVFEIPGRQAVRPTFYGRDVFAPFVASHLRGRKARLMRIDKMEGKEFPESEMFPDHWLGTVICIDHFGNIVSNIPIEKTGPCELRAHRKKFGIALNYLGIKEKDCALIAGSHGFWEVAARKDSAARLLKLRVGDPIYLFPTKTVKN